MIIRVVDEYNEKGHLVYAENFVGAFSRGKTREEAFAKLESEIVRYGKWSGIEITNESIEIKTVQEKLSSLDVCDADSDVIFDSERLPLITESYEYLKKLALKSAADFLAMYNSVPEKDKTLLKPRKTFYGFVPATAREMYEHTKNVNSYYFGEIGITAENEQDILACRQRGFEETEKQKGFLSNKVFMGSYNEEWSLAKVVRRFIWHDRIHAKAMFRMACALSDAYGYEKPVNPFYF